MFFVLGLYYGTGKKINIPLNLIILLLLVTLFLSVCETAFFTQKIGYLNATKQKVGNLIFSLFAILLFFNNTRHKTSYQNPMGKFLAYIGQISFGIYLIHMHVLLYLSLFFNHYFPGTKLNQPLSMILILTISIIIISMVKKVNNPFAVKYLGF